MTCGSYRGTYTIFGSVLWIATMSSSAVTVCLSSVTRLPASLA